MRLSKHNTIIILIALAVIASIALVTVFGFLTAGKRVDAYHKDLGTWQQQIRSFAKRAAANTYSNNMAIGSPETDAQLTSLTTACTNAKAYKTELTTKLQPPTLGGNVLGFLNSKYRSAKDTEQQTRSHFSTIQAQLTKQLSAYAIFCDYYNYGVKADRILDKLVAERHKHMREPGSSTTTWTSATTFTTYSCDKSDWCLPIDTNEWPTITTLSQQVEDQYYKPALRYVSTHPCFFADYQKVCDTEKAYFTAYSKSYQSYIDALNAKDLTATNKTDAANSQIYTDYGKKYAEAYKQISPGINTDADSYEVREWQHKMQMIEQSIAKYSGELL